MSKQKVLFIDVVHPGLEDRLKLLGYDCERDYSCSFDELLDKIDRYTGLVVRSRVKIDKKLIEAATALKFIARSGAGLENIELASAKANNIAVFNAPEGNREAVAEHAIGMLLSLFRNICKGNSEVRTGKWKREHNRGIELKGMAVGIIGYGNTGSEFAKRLGGFGCKVMAYDKYKNDFGNELVSEVQMEEIFEHADVLSLHIPLSQETEYLVDNQYLQRFKKNIFLINTARGNQVKTDELVRNLKSGKVRGACLDVLEYEKSSFETLRNKSFSKESPGENELPPAFNELKRMDNVIFSPHVAGWTHESYVKLSRFLADKIENEFHR